LNPLLADMMVLDGSFLVDRDGIEAFEAQVQQLDEVQAGRLVFTYAGPLPPYSFVTLRLNWMRHGAQPARSPGP